MKVVSFLSKKSQQVIIGGQHDNLDGRSDLYGRDGWIRALLPACSFM
jgi:hypothetical protein